MFLVCLWRESPSSVLIMSCRIQARQCFISADFIPFHHGSYDCKTHDLFLSLPAAHQSLQNIAVF